MSVRINVPPYLQSSTDNVTVVELNGKTIGECLNDLVTQFPEALKMLFDKDGKLLGYIGICVNGEVVYPDELVKLVKDGDELHLPYIITGG